MDTRLHPGITLREAYEAAARAGMYLIDNGLGDVRVAPIIPPGWRQIPMVAINRELQREAA